MKKLLIALLALTVAGTAFAADPALTFSGALKTGIQFTSSDADKDDETGIDPADGFVTTYNDDAGKTTRLDLKGAYTDGDFGLKFRLRSNAFEAPVVNYAYAWGNLFSNKVTFKAGDIDDDAWETEGDEGFDLADDQGLQIQIKPIEGLNFGVKFATTAAYETDDETYYGETYEQFANEMGFGAAYTSDVFNAQAGVKLDGDREMDLGDTNDFAGVEKVYRPSLYAIAVEEDLDNDVNASAYVGFNLKVAKALKLIAEIKFFNLGAYSDIGYTWSNVEVGYDINEQISVGILSYEWTYGDSDLETYVDIKPYVNFKLNETVTLGAEIGYAVQDKMTDLWVKPSATVQFGKKAKFVGFYKYDKADYDDLLDVKDPIATNTIQLDFIWEF